MEPCFFCWISYPPCILFLAISLSKCFCICRHKIN
jgi:hypothetical protein